MQTSTNGINKLLATEGFSAKAYPDPKGQTKTYSIGYGHQIQSNESALLKQIITKSKGLELFRLNLKPLEALLNSKAKYKLNQNQFDALVSFGYNCGIGALERVLETWNTTHSSDLTTKHMSQYKFVTTDIGKKVSPALVERRKDETSMFSKPYVPVLAIAGIALGLFLFS
jgi:lysozyme